MFDEEEYDDDEDNDDNNNDIDVDEIDGDNDNNFNLDFSAADSVTRDWDTFCGDSERFGSKELAVMTTFGVGGDGNKDEIDAGNNTVSVFCGIKVFGRVGVGKLVSVEVMGMVIVEEVLFVEFVLSVIVKGISCVVDGDEFLSVDVGEKDEGIIEDSGSLWLDVVVGVGGEQHSVANGGSVKTSSATFNPPSGKSLALRSSAVEFKMRFSFFIAISFSQSGVELIWCRRWETNAAKEGGFCECDDAFFNSESSALESFFKMSWTSAFSDVNLTPALLLPSSICKLSSFILAKSAF